MDLEARFQEKARRLEDRLDDMELDLFHLATEVWLECATIRTDGSRVAGDSKLAAEAEEVLRKYGKLNERGRFTWENVQ